MHVRINDIIIKAEEIYKEGWMMISEGIKTGYLLLRGVSKWGVY